MTDQTENAGKNWQHIEAIAAEVDAEINPEFEPADTPEQSAPDHDLELEGLLTEGIHITSAILAPNWKITKDESATLGGVYARLINKYFPDAGANMGIEITALLATGAIIGSRIGTPRKLEEKRHNGHSSDEPETLDAQPVKGGGDE